MSTHLYPIDGMMKALVDSHYVFPESGFLHNFTHYKIVTFEN